ncbi:MAG: hypothetical protein HDR74_02565 [Bacteroides sp.]|nr:hypothetical protein [Bacteroidales bacterium]MBD5378765.1 hypothetical protein [Bacteroides sp.]MDE5810436.1 hypothetical protein [Muribaculaceae bacterium]
MKQKIARLPLISEVLNSEIIDSQETLLKILKGRGVNVTQATLSRDLRKLNATKVALPTGGFRYKVFPSQTEISRPEVAKYVTSRIANPDLANQDILSFAISNNLVVIKTRNGCAGALAYDIDMLCFPEIIGTIPGTDTLLVVIDENLSREQIIRLLMELIPDAITTEATIKQSQNRRRR